MQFITKREQEIKHINDTYDLYELQDVELEDGTMAKAKKLVETVSKENLERQKENLEAQLSKINTKLKLIAGLEEE